LTRAPERRIAVHISSHLPPIDPRTDGISAEAREHDGGVRLDPGAVAVLLGAAAALLIGASVLQHLVYGFEEPVGRLNLDTELSLGTWFQAGLLAVAAAVGGLIAVTQRRASKPYAGHWMVLAAVLLLLSVDEGLALHEELIAPLRSALDASGIIYFAWVVPGAAFALAFAVAYARFVLRLPAAPRRYVLLGGGLYLCGALAMEALNGAYASANGLDSLTYRLLTDLEEALEMGLVVLIYGFLSFLGGVRLSAGVAAHDGVTADEGLAAAREAEPVG
jgi:hypothetical protein